MSVDALLKLRDDIGTVLQQKSQELQSQLSRLGDSIVGKGRNKGIHQVSSKSGNTWSGLGAQPRWMTAAIKDGAKRDDFLLDRPAKRARKKKTKR
jgi:hypothetical protein